MTAYQINCPTILMLFLNENKRQGNWTGSKRVDVGPDCTSIIHDLSLAPSWFLKQPGKEKEHELMRGEHRYTYIFLLYA